MVVWKHWAKVKKEYGETKIEKEYKMLLLFGFIPLFISVNG